MAIKALIVEILPTMSMVEGIDILEPVDWGQIRKERRETSFSLRAGNNGVVLGSRYSIGTTV
jgi:hypothetical protein